MFRWVAVVLPFIRTTPTQQNIQERDTQRRTQQKGAQRTNYNTCARASDGPTHVTAATTNSGSFRIRYISTCDDGHIGRNMY
jgi:hypothetical protein